jgi:hypothetical protein
MALAFTNLTVDESTTDGSSFATASVSPAANNLIVVAVAYRRSGSGFVVPTVSGAGLTFDMVNGGEYTAGRGVVFFRALSASPSTGAITIDFGAVTVLSLCWSVDQASGVDTSGTNGAGAVVQSLENTPGTNGTALAASLAAFGSANNAAYGVFSVLSNSQDMVPDSPLSQLAETAVSADVISLMTCWALNTTAVGATWTSSVGRGMAAMEVNAGADTDRVPRYGFVNHQNPGVL